MKKLLIIGLFVAVVLSVVPVVSDAQGLVPCGGEGQPNCNVCHAFKLVNNIEQFLLYPDEQLNNNAPPIPIIGAIFILVGGFYLLIAAGNPERLQKAKTILTAAIVGFVIVYASVMLVGVILSSAGATEWAGFLKPIEVQCEGEKVDFGNPKE